MKEVRGTGKNLPGRAAHARRWVFLNVENTFSHHTLSVALLDVVPLAERVLVAGRRESVRGAVISSHKLHFPTKTHGRLFLSVHGPGAFWRTPSFKLFRDFLNFFTNN